MPTSAETRLRLLIGSMTINVCALEGRVEELQGQLAEQQTLVKARDAEIATLNEKIAVLNAPAEPPPVAEPQAEAA